MSKDMNGEQDIKFEDSWYHKFWRWMERREWGWGVHEGIIRNHCDESMMATFQMQIGYMIDYLIQHNIEWEIDHKSCKNAAEFWFKLRPFIGEIFKNSMTYEDMIKLFASDFWRWDWDYE